MQASHAKLGLELKRYQDPKAANKGITDEFAIKVMEFYATATVELEALTEDMNNTLKVTKNMKIVFLTSQMFNQQYQFDTKFDYSAKFNLEKHIIKRFL